jgi:formate dehydrogenase alpha subunit
MTNSIAEIEDADCIFIIGSNTTVAHPLVAYRVYRAKAKGAKVIVADPRRIHMTTAADLHVRQKLGSDVALLNGIMNVILSRGWRNSQFIEERTEGFDKLQEVLKNYPPERASEICGVSVEDIVKIAEAYATSEKSTILYAMGITQHSHGVDNVKSLANLAMMTGQIGRPSTGVNPLRGQNNVQGACDMGGLPNVYPAYQPVIDEGVKKKFEDAWAGSLSGKVGYTIMEMMHGLEDGSVNALFIMGENPVGSDPDVNHVRHALQSAEFLVVMDIFLTDTAKLAHVVLPGAAFAEKDGTFVNTERKVLRVRKAVDPPGDAQPDWAILCELGVSLGLEMDYASPSDIFDEIAKVAPSYGGLSYARIEKGGIPWPCPAPDHPGTPILHKERFTRGRGLFHAIEYRPPEELVDDEYPMQLTTGRFFPHYHTGTMTRNSPTLHGEMPEGYTEIHPEDAARLGLADRDTAKIVSRRGEVVSKVVVTDMVDPGTIFMTFHFMEANANVLTNPALDPICKIPEFKVCAVRVEKVDPSYVAAVPTHDQATRPVRSAQPLPEAAPPLAQAEAPAAAPAPASTAAETTLTVAETPSMDSESPAEDAETSSTADESTTEDVETSLTEAEGPAEEADAAPVEAEAPLSDSAPPKRGRAPKKASKSRPAGKGGGRRR